MRKQAAIGAIRIFLQPAQHLSLLLQHSVHQPDRKPSSPSANVKDMSRRSMLKLMIKRNGPHRCSQVRLP